MKIGFVTTYFYPVKGGAENNCYYLARELARRHEVHIFASGEKNKTEIINSIKVHRCRTLFRYKYYFAFYPSILSEILKYDLDIIHFHSLGFLQHDVALLAIKLLKPKTKLVCTPHGPFMALEDYPAIEKLFKTIVEAFERITNGFYDLIIQVNPVQQDWFSKKGLKGKVCLIPNGIVEEVFAQQDAGLFEKYNLDKSFIISYLGRLQAYKGLDQIIEILPDLVKLNPKIKFVVMGKDFGEKQKLMELARRKNVEENIAFTGELNDKEKLAILGASEIFVFPSRWEAFGIAMLEAMAQGNAVVSTRTEGGKYLVEEGKNGFLFDYGNLAELRQKLIALVEDTNLRRRIQKENINKARGFIWQDLARNLEQEYIKLLGK